MNLHAQKTSALILSGRDVTAILGPTNTGKTHLAIERMVAHESGVIGLPLRLLAREVYSRVAARVGIENVALITGEEKIAPPGARYSVCTVEAMPRQTDAAFVAIDEVQLAADLERGHIFTDRILHLRGRQETLLLGAGTMRGILEKLLRGLSVVTRPRMSVLSYAGSKKITRLPRRSAIVAFSADEVYAIGELIRRQSGGAAIVLGALSPRTRNAQVALYQSGDVDYLVATDAIGMGLNLDVDHVAFAQNRKFDGFQYRGLTAAELGQIAGRAGRHVRDGTFGVTGQVDPLDDALVERIQSHDFDPVRILQWRTAEIDASSLDALKASLEATPPVEGLTKALPAADLRVLEHLSREPEIRALATGRDRVALLWDACALPDYRKIAPAHHAEIVGSIYTDLARNGHVDEGYMADQVRRASSTEGEIDTLSHRIAQIRTWTFVANRPGWLADPTHWQEKTREIEDQLSDALHERLTKRFVDRRTSVLMKRLRENTMPEAEISPGGEVLVEGHHVGELQGFRFTADRSAEGEDARAVKAAAQKALAVEFESRAERFGAAPNGDIALGSDGTLRWLGAPIATLVESDDALKPRVVLLADEQLTGPARDKVAARAERFVNFQVETHLKPLLDLRQAESLSGIARGLAFQLSENFGLLNRRDVAEEVRSLDQDARAALRRLGVRFGAYHVFIPALIKPAPAGLASLLWALKNDGKDKPGFGDVVGALAAGRTSIVTEPAFERAFYRLAGFRNLGRRAVRVDILERLADLIRPALAWKPGTGQRPGGAYDGNAFVVTPAMMSILGATADDMEAILKGLGYRGEPKAAAEVTAHLEALDAAEASAEAAETVAEESAGGAEAADSAGENGHAAAAESVAAQAAQECVIAGGSVPNEAASAERQEPVETPVTPVETASVETVADGAPTATEEPARTDQPAAADGQDTADAPPASETDAAATNGGAGTGDGEAEPEEEPKPVFIWRPARFDGHRRHGRQHSHDNATRPRGKGRGKGGRPNGEDDRKPGFKGKGKRPAPRSREERPPRIDPDSPFAKLAALRDQLKK